MSNHFFDVLIIGSGGAGLTAAILSAKKGKKVAVISKVEPLKSHTIAAQGGINAALGNITHDKPEWHIYDTIKASDWLADEDAVEIMCNNASNAIKLLDELGVEFDRTSEGKIDQKIYGGQSTEFGKGGFAHRACYSKDKTGHTIMHSLYNETQKHNVEFFNYHFVLDLIMSDNDCLGVVCLNIETGEIKVIFSSNTIIATGGYSQIYRVATSAAICTGDGNGLIARAGLPLQDMEFVQFHPTALHNVGVLITEASRSAGGKLLNSLGQRFMQNYAPNFMELAARDVVARAISTEIMQGRGAGPNEDHVWLDLTRLGEKQIKETLPTVFENCQKFLKLNPSLKPIPISPAAHYTMGGIPTDINCKVIANHHNQTVVGLFAIGEAACISVHGANRLGCNSLLDLLVFAQVTVDNLSDRILDNLPDTEEILKLTNERINKLFGESTLNIDNLTIKMKDIVNKYAGVFRNKESLETGFNLLQEVKNEMLAYRISDKDLAWNIDFIKFMELSNMIISAEATIKSALWRNESRGAHYRQDFEDKDSNYLVHTLIWLPDFHVEPREVRRIQDHLEFSNTRDY